MIKYFLILMLFFSKIGYSVYFEKTHTIIQCNNILIWSAERKLKWSDFQGNKKDFNDFGKKAESTCGIQCEMIKKNEDYLPVFETYSYFIKNQSWTISWKDNTLEHEQIHFDIFELYARKIRKSIDSLHNENEREIEIYLDCINKSFKGCDEYNDLYDREVYTIMEDSGVIFKQEIQDLWKIRIQNELRNLNEYELKGG